MNNSEQKCDLCNGYGLIERLNGSHVECKRCIDLKEFAESIIKNDEIIESKPEPFAPKRGRKPKKVAD